TAIAAEEQALFVECSPHPVLTPAIGVGRATGTLRRHDGGWRRFLTAAAEAHVHGLDVGWAAAVAGAASHGPGGPSGPAAGDLVDLPTYPFRRRNYWLNRRRRRGDVTAAGLLAADHPLLGATVPAADGGGAVHTGSLSLATHSWLGEHRVGESIVVPGTVFVELATLGGDDIEELMLEAPLVIPEQEAVTLQVKVEDTDEPGRRRVTIHGRRGEHPWARHASGVVVDAAGPAGGGDDTADLAVWPPPGASPVEIDGLYDRLASLGLRYGTTFRGLRAAWRLGADLYAEVQLPEGADPDGYGVHPALLDAALHSLLAGTDQVRLPMVWSGVRVRAVGARTLRAHLRTTGEGQVSLRLADHAGSPVASVGSLLARPVTLDRVAPDSRDCLFTVDWVPVAIGDGGTGDSEIRAGGTGAATGAGAGKPAAWATIGETGLDAPAAYEDLDALLAVVRVSDAETPEAV